MSNPEEIGGSDDGDGGSPGWIMTFADLMSLLLAFFVLLFSFSSTDDEKYKVIGGSIKDAFGVQTRYVLLGPPKGVNHIAREFSSGRPDPTILNVVPQLNLDIDRVYDSTEEPTKSDMQKEKEGVEKKVDISDPEMKALKDSKTVFESQSVALGLTSDTQREAGAETQENNTQAADANATAQEQAFNDEKARTSLAEAVAKSQGRELGEQLASEIANGQLTIETKGSTIVIRLSEEGSFLPGSSAAIPSLESMLDKIGETIADTPGKVVVEGHTDNLPIDTTRYRSNWELSAARAVTVVHGLLERTGMPEKRFEVHGLADTQPIAANDSFQGRAENRRVEVVLEYDSLKTVPKDYKAIAEDYLRATQPELFDPVDPSSPEGLERAFEKSLRQLNIGPTKVSDEANFIFQDSFFR